MIPREILRQVRRIEISTRGLVNEVFSGEYHSVFKGRGMNFSEVREYQYGDDIRNIDWNVTARAGSPFVKIYEERELELRFGDDHKVIEQVEIQARYAGYIERQRDEIERHRRHEETSVPDDFDYARVRGLSAEVCEKLVRVRPATVGQAARIAGVTPAAISLLLVHLKKHAAASRKSA